MGDEMLEITLDYDNDWASETVAGRAPHILPEAWARAIESFRTNPPEPVLGFAMYTGGRRVTSEEAAAIIAVACWLAPE